MPSAEPGTPSASLGAAAELLDREAQRIQTAAAHQALPELVATLHHQAHVHGGSWHLPDTDPRAVRLPDHGLRLTPLLAGPGAARIHYGGDGLLISILYPLPGAVRLLDRDSPLPGDGLQTLIGAQRAKVLRLLDRPHRIGHIAQALDATPAAATYHVSMLEATGLIVRERAGRSVIAHRTARGTALLNLYPPARQW